MGRFMTAKDQIYPTRLWQLNHESVTVPGQSCAGQAALIAGHNDSTPTSTGVANGAAAGSATPMSAMPVGFAVGETILIDPFGGPETAMIAAVGSVGASGTGITITPALASAHVVGAPLSGGDAPLEGKRGAVARFAVELHNASATAVRFDRCPLLVELLAPAGRPEVHQLNCRAASPIQPAGSVRFEMRIQVPANAPAAANGLFWELDPTGAQGPRAASRLVVAS